MKGEDEVRRFTGRRTLYYEKCADEDRRGFKGRTGQNSRVRHCTHGAIVPGNFRIVGMNMANLQEPGEGNRQHANQTYQSG